jgi:3-oxoacyl-[acyl-carrier protein] reductase
MAAGALRDRVCIVTGGARGLGRAYAGRLHAAGARVAVLDLDGARAAETAAALGGEGTVLALDCDVTDEHAVAAAVERVVSTWPDGSLVLVNNAGGAMLPAGPSEDIDRVGGWDRVLGVNLTAQWLCARAVVPHMRADGYGKIINIGSAMVPKGWPVGMSPYMAAKAGVIGLTRALAREWGPAGIRVNVLAPGYVPVDTPKVVHDPTAEPALRERIAAEQCLPVTLVPEDLCGPLEFLASADSDAVTGQVLTVDGGWTLAS